MVGRTIFWKSRSPLRLNASFQFHCDPTTLVLGIKNTFLGLTPGAPAEPCVSQGSPSSWPPVDQAEVPALRSPLSQQAQERLLPEKELKTQLLKHCFLSFLSQRGTKEVLQGSRVICHFLTDLQIPVADLYPSFTHHLGLSKAKEAHIRAPKHPTSQRAP